MKAVKHIPAGRIKKMIFPSSDGGAANPASSATITTTTPTTTTAAGIKRKYPSPSPSPTPLTQPPAVGARPLSVDPSVRLTHFEDFKRLVPNHNHTKIITNNITISTNGRPKSPPKSGILIKRNHMKNFTIRQLNIVRSAKANDDADEEGDAKKSNNNNDDESSNNNRMIQRTVRFTINKNSKNGKDHHRSLKTLIADLEN